MRAERLLAGRAAMPALFGLVALAVYGPGLGHPFVYDDMHSIVANKALRALDNIPAYFWDLEMFSNQRRGTMFRPLLLVSYAFNYRVHGDEVWGFRLFNLLLHVCCSWAVAYLARWASGSRLCAWLAGTVFLLHPVHAEPAMYISARSDLLSGALYLWALVWVLEKRSGLSWAGYAAALLTKSVAITLPVQALLGAVWRGGAQALRVHRRGLLGMGLLSMAYIAAIMANRFLPSSLAKAPRSFDEQLWTQLKGGVYYLWLYAMPVRLSVEHPFFVSSRLDEAAVLLAGALLGSLCYWAWKGRRRLWGAGWAFFALALAPVALVPLNVLVSERRLYLASTGLVLAAAWALRDLCRRRRRWGPVLVGGLGLVFALGASERVGQWRDEITLWEDAVAKGPGMFRARANLGIAYLRAGRLPEAEEQLRQALGIKPDYADAWVELGNMHHRRGELSQAERAYRKALEYSPELEGVYYNLGNIYQGQGRWAEAIAQYRAALKRRPGYAEARNNLAQALEGAGDPAAALVQYERALALAPDLPQAWYNRAALLEKRGDEAAALEGYRRARRLLLDHPDFAKNPQYGQFAARAAAAIQRLQP